MRKILTGIGILVFSVLIIAVAWGLFANKEVHVETETIPNKTVRIGQTPMSSYKISYASNGAYAACNELKYYIQQTSNDVLDVVPHRRAGEYFIKKSIAKNV